MNEQPIAPPQLGGKLEWEAKGAGYDLRRVVTTKRKRRRLYVCHLSQARWAKLRAQHSDEALPDVLRQWAKGFRKSITRGRIIAGRAAPQRVQCGVGSPVRIITAVWFSQSAVVDCSSFWIRLLMLTAPPIVDVFNNAALSR